MVGSRDDERGHVWLLDFGIAKMETGGMSTEELPAVGTLAYLSPEQASHLCQPARRGQRPKLDWRADIYSFGCVLYEVITGRHPLFDLEDPPDTDKILSGVQTTDPKLMHEHRADCPRELSEIAARCLAKDPSSRYRSLEEVRDALRECLLTVSRRQPPNAIVERKLEQDEARSARLAAFSKGSLADEDGEEVARGSAAHGPRQNVTADLPSFVPSSSPLPFGQPPTSAPSVPVPALPVPSLRGKGHTVKIPRSALPPASPETTSAPAAMAPPATTRTLAAIAPLTMARAPTAVAPSTTRLPEPRVLSSSLVTPPAMIGGQISSTPIAAPGAPSRPSPPPLLLTGGVGLAILLAGAALVITMRSQAPIAPAAVGPATSSAAGVSSASATAEALPSPSATAAATAATGSVEPTASAAPDSAVTPAPTVSAAARPPKTEETANAPSPKKPQRAIPAGAKPAPKEPKIFPLFDEPPPPKGRR